MNSSPRFWIVAGLLALAATALEGAPTARAAPGPTLHPADTLRAFLVAETGAQPSPVVLRRRLPEWSGWRFATAACEATAVPLSPGGDFDLDARRKVGPGETLVFVYAGKMYETPPQARANLDHIAGLTLASLGLGKVRPHYYVGLIRAADCQNAGRLDWARLWDGPPAPL